MTEPSIKKGKHIIDENEVRLCQVAEELSEELDGVDIVIIAAGEGGTRFGRCTTGSTILVRPGKRLRDLFGILETAKQIETLKHFRLLPGQTDEQEDGPHAPDVGEY